LDYNSGINITTLQILTVLCNRLIISEKREQTSNRLIYASIGFKNYHDPFQLINPYEGNGWLGCRQRMHHQQARENHERKDHHSCHHVGPSCQHTSCRK